LLWKIKNPRQMVYENLPGLELGPGERLEQIEFLGPANSRAPVIHSQLAKNVFRVRAKSIWRDD
jgi:hypothetical protein